MLILFKLIKKNFYLLLSSILIITISLLLFRLRFKLFTTLLLIFS